VILTKTQKEKYVAAYFGITGKPNLFYRDPTLNGGGAFHMVKNVVSRFGLIIIRLSRRLKLGDGVLALFYGHDKKFEVIEAKPPQLDGTEIRRRSRDFPEITALFQEKNIQEILQLCQDR